MKKRYLWDDDQIQFARLLTEVNAVGLSAEQIKSLCASMDVQPDDIREIFDRAERVFAHQCRVVGSVR